MGMAEAIAARLTIEPKQKSFQITHFIRARTALVDDMGMQFSYAELQKRDLQLAMSMFKHRFYVRHCVDHQGETRGLMFHQVQLPQDNGFRIFGTLVTDEDGKFLMNCVETEIPRQVQKNREVMDAAKRRLCR